MKSITAKRVDYWLGIPICILLSVLKKFTCFKRKSKFKGKNKKVLFIELSEIGAAILAYPAITLSRQLNHDAEIFFLIFKENADSVKVLGVIKPENILTIRSSNAFYFLIDTFSILLKIRSLRFDALLDMELFSRFTSIISFFSKAEKKAGFDKFCLEGLFRADAYTHRVIYNPYMHISNNFLSLVYALGQDESDLPLSKVEIKKLPEYCLPEIKINNSFSVEIKAKLRSAYSDILDNQRIVIVNPGFGEYLPLRRWPLEYYKDLTEKLLTQYKDILIVLTGVRQEISQKPEPFLKHSRCINLIGKTSIEELVALCNMSRVLISHDCGVINLASLTKVDVIVMFGPETPLLYAPLTSKKKIFYSNLSCSPCFSAYNHRSSVCKNNLCMKLISVDEVYSQACKFLD